MTFTFTDRYQALGIPYPDPQTMCQGYCEGTGVLPLYKYDYSRWDYRLTAAWLETHEEMHSWYGRIASLWKAIKGCDKIYFGMAFEVCDGWHFVKCPDCHGTGKRT